MKTVIGLFDDYDQAERAVLELLDRRLAPSGDITVIARDEVRRTHQKEPELGYELREHGDSDAVLKGAGAGCALLGGVGGVLGVLAGVGVIALPGLGTVVAGGPVLAALAGATVGAVGGAVAGAAVGELARLGVPELDAHFYAEGVARGGTLIVVRAANDDADRIAYVMTEHGAIDVEERRRQFKTSGFTAGSVDATSYSADQIAGDHEREHAIVRATPSPSRGQVFGR